MQISVSSIRNYLLRRSPGTNAALCDSGCCHQSGSRTDITPVLFLNCNILTVHVATPVSVSC